MTREDDPARDPAALAAVLEAMAREGGANIDPAAIRVVRAPGRVNLIGEHTDYNDGLVLPAAIDRWISIAFVPSDDGVVRLRSLDTGDAVTVDVREPGAADGTWRDYVAGMAWALGKAPAARPLTGLDGVLASDLPMGAGLSSSAALELAVALALGGGDPPIAEPMALAANAQRAENDFVGVPCGLMDQFAVTFGEPDAALLLDCRTLRHEGVPLPAEIEILVCQSGVERRLAGSAYETRRAECARAVAGLRRAGTAVDSLRDVDASMLDAAGPDLDPIALRRARHVVSENARVVDTVAALRAGDLAALGALFAASHASLRDDFEVSTPELDALVDVAVRAPGVVAARMTGAGFGGAIVALAHADAADRATAAIRDGYRTPAGAPPDVLSVRATSGAGIAWPPA